MPAAGARGRAMSRPQHRIRPWKTLAAYLLAHAAVVQLVPVAWLAPNLTLAGVVASVGVEPRRWLWLSGAAGLLSMVWAVSGGWRLLAGYLLVGGLVRWAAGHWDTGDRRVLTALTGAGASLLAGLWLWWIPARPWALVAWALLHVVLTAGVAWVAQGELRDA